MGLGDTVGDRYDRYAFRGLTFRRFFVKLGSCFAKFVSCSVSNSKRRGLGGISSGTKWYSEVPSPLTASILLTELASVATAYTAQ